MTTTAGRSRMRFDLQTGVWPAILDLVHSDYHLEMYAVAHPVDGFNVATMLIPR